MNRACLSPCYRRSSVLFALLLAFSLLMVMPAYAQFTLVKVSGDSFNNPESQHKTEVEPDTYSWGSTMMAAFSSFTNFRRRRGRLGICHHHRRRENLDAWLAPRLNCALQAGNP